MTPEQLKNLGLRMCNWHSGTDKVYAVGSFAIAGQVHEPEVIEGAKAMLESYVPQAEAGMFGWGKEDAHELRGMIADLTALQNEQELDEFTRGYFDCAFWSETDDDELPLEDNYDSGDLAEEARTKLIADCASFQAHEAALLKSAYEVSGYNAGKAGHDFWLTRNGHGTGFWDRGLGDVGKKLTDAAHAYGTCGLYIGDDDKVYDHG